MNAFYIVSTKKRAQKDKYKIGIHTGSKTLLMSRYATYLIKPIVYYFIYMNDNYYVEKTLLEKFDKYRITNIFGNQTEWINLELNDIISIFNNVYNELILDYYRYNKISNINKLNFVNETDGKSKSKITRRKKNIKNNIPNLESICEMNDVIEEFDFTNISKTNNETDPINMCNNDTIIDKINNNEIDFINIHENNDNINEITPPYKCNSCKAIFDRKSNYLRHLDRKKPCRVKKVRRNRSRHICQYCEHEFTRNYSLLRHHKICTNKNTKDIITNENNRENITNSYNNNNTKNIYNGDVTNNYTMIIVPPDKNQIENSIDDKKIKEFVNNDNHESYLKKDTAPNIANKKNQITQMENIKRQITYILDFLSEFRIVDKMDIISFIAKHDNIDSLKNIAKILASLLIFKEEINAKIIENKIAKQNEINNFIW